MELATDEPESPASALDQAAWWVEVERDHRGATVTVDATTMGTPELAQFSELLEWLVATGSTSVRVDLGTMASIDAVLLDLLRSVRERLDGALVANSGRADVHRALALIGLDRRPPFSVDIPAGRRFVRP